MSNFLALYRNLELEDIDEINRNKNVVDFCKLVEIIRNEKIYVGAQIKAHKYSFGNFYANLAYCSWQEVKENPMLKGIGQTTHNLLSSLTFQHSSLFKLFVGKDEDFVIQGLSAYLGYNRPSELVPYLFSPADFSKLRQEYYTNNQNLIVWGDNVIFPEEELVIKILLREIAIHGKEVGPDEKVSIVFHNIMRLKGPEIHAYAEKIASELLTINYYKFEEEISKNEQAYAKSFRQIFSIQKNGRIQYVSIDFRHGMLELIDYNNNHVGEYRLDGSYNTGKDQNHALKTI